MQQTTPRNSATFLATYRSGALVAVAEDMPLAVARRRPRGFLARQARQRAQVAGGGQAGRVAASSPIVGVVEIRGYMEQRASCYSMLGESDGYDAIWDRFSSAIYDPGVASVVLDADSPGGDDAGLWQLIAKMVRAKAETGKRVFAFVNEVAASAGIALLAGTCDGIYGPDSMLVGSIAQVIVYQGRLPGEREEVVVFRGLPGKMVPSSVEPINDLGRARLQARADAGTQKFIAAMAKYRGLDPQVIRNWNGEVFTGAAAVAAGLADGTDFSLESVIALASSLAELGKSA